MWAAGLGAWTPAWDFSGGRISLGPQTAKRRAGAPSILHFFLRSIANDVQDWGSLTGTWNLLLQTEHVQLLQSVHAAKVSYAQTLKLQICCISSGSQGCHIQSPGFPLGGKNFQRADTCGKNAQKNPLWWHLLCDTKCIAWWTCHQITFDEQWMKVTATGAHKLSGGFIQELLLHRAYQPLQIYHGVKEGRCGITKVM